MDTQTLQGTKQEVLLWSPRPEYYQVIPDIPTASNIILFGGRGIGKTWNGCRWLITQALTYPRTTWLAVAQTWSDALTVLAEGEGGVIWHILGDTENPDPAKRRASLEPTLKTGALEGSFVKTPGAMAVRFSNGSVIRFASADKPSSLRGKNAHGAFADEVGFWAKEAFDMLRFGVRSRLPDGKPARILCSTTPNGMNWFYDYFLNPAVLPNKGIAFVGGDDDGRLFPSRVPSTLDNPHTDDYFKEEALRRYEGTDVGEQEIYGKITSMRGAIFPSLTEFNHSRTAFEDRGGEWITKPEDADEVIAGLDLGVKNLSALVVLARKGTIWQVVAEATKPTAETSELIKLIDPLISYWNPEKVFTDINYPLTSSDLKKAGYPIVDTAKPNKSVISGITIIQNLLGTHTLVFDTDACKVLWREMKNYKWKTNSDGTPRDREEPVKFEDHATDALRYALYMSSNKKKEFYASWV